MSASAIEDDEGGPEDGGEPRKRSAPRLQPQTKVAKAARAVRLAEEMRSNLRKRKQQQRAQASTDDGAK